MALIDDLRGITATEGDDYFQDAVLVSYFNQAQLQVASLATIKERLGNVSYRALDGLRSTQTNNPSGFTQVGDYYEGTDTLPNDFLQWLYLRYNQTPLKQLPKAKQYLLQQGNAIPDQYEGYFAIGVNNIELFIHEDPDGASDDVVLEYIAKPTDITDTDTELPEFPDQLLGAITYKAAVLMGIQEGREDLKTYQETFNEEIQANLY